MAALIALLGAGGGLTVYLNINVQVEQKFGWAGEEVAAQAYAQLAPEFPKFAITGAAVDDPSQPALLWELAKLANGGEHLPTVQQWIGDCVGASGAQCVQYLMALNGDGTTWKPLFIPYHYAVGRNAPSMGAGRIRGPDGSVGSWQALAIRDYGVIPLDAPGLPKYSVQSAREWATRMPAVEWQELGRLHVVRTVARANAAADVRRGLQNGYPCTIASSFGTNTIRTYQGMRLARWDTSWPHQMCVIGYQQVEGQGYYYVLNSWGPRAHESPLNGEPPGGFWITERDLEGIIRQGDTWIYSDAVGFPAKPLFPIFSDHDQGRTQSCRPSMRRSFSCAA